MPRESPLLVGWSIYLGDEDSMIRRRGILPPRDFAPQGKRNMNEINFATRFVTRVNEIYHDVEADTYTQRHPEIFIDEVERWNRIAREYLIRDTETTVLDIGTGTGFVPLVIGPFLKREDTIICSDVSTLMLRVCRNEIAKRRLDCQVKFVKLNGDLSSVGRRLVDVVTMNSVLHHLPNVDEFCRQISTVLSKDSLLIVAHEPNKLFYNNWFLWNSYLLLSLLMNERVRASSKSENHRLPPIVQFLLGRKRTGPDRTLESDSIAHKVNMRLVEEGLIKEPMTVAEISATVDFNDPNAGGFHKDRGFDISQLLRCMLPDFDLVHFETYNHCCKLTSRNLFTRFYANLLRRVLPEKGADFLAVLRKC